MFRQVVLNGLEVGREGGTPGAGGVGAGLEHPVAVGPLRDAEQGAGAHPAGQALADQGQGSGGGGQAGGEFLEDAVQGVRQQVMDAGLVVLAGNGGQPAALEGG